MMKATEDVVGVSIPVDRYVLRLGEPFYDEDGEVDFNMLTGMLEEIEWGREVA